jgi:hypothetical protein
VARRIFWCRRGRFIFALNALGGENGITEEVVLTLLKKVFRAESRSYPAILLVIHVEFLLWAISLRWRVGLASGACGLR